MVLGVLLTGTLLLVPPLSGNASGLPARAALTEGRAVFATPTAILPPDRNGWVNTTALTRQPSPGLESYAPAVVDGTSQTAMVFGGLGPHGNVSGTTWIFDDGNWEDISPVINGASPPPLYDTDLAYDASDGYLLLFGGRTATGALYGGTWSWSYPEYHWTNRTGASSPPPEAGGGMAYDAASGEVVLEDPASNLTWAYHDGMWSARSVTPSPGARTGAVMLTDSADGDVVLFGGRSVDGGAQLNDTWTYTRETWTERPTAEGPPPVVNASGTDDLLLGGILLVGSVPGGAEETWNYTGGVWAEYALGTVNPAPRHGATLAYDTTGASILCGGTEPNGSRWLDDCWSWDVAFIPPKGVANASPITVEVEGAAAAAVLVPLAVAIYLSTRPRRPDPSRVPVPTPSGEAAG